MSNPIKIPDVNRRNIIFETDPGDDIVREIKAFIRETKAPHTWWGHSHTKPAPGSMPIYLDEFEIPAPKNVLAVAPCPCCPHDHAKYKNGKIAWFPEERVIRMIGPDCYAALDREGHNEALINMRKEQRRRSQIETILEHLPRLPEIINIARSAIPIAEDLDAVESALKSRLENTLRMRAWDALKEGQLRVRETATESYQKADGSTGEKQIETFRGYARIRGVQILNPTNRPSAPIITRAVERLIAIAKGVKDTNVHALQDVERARIARSVTQEQERLRGAFADMRDRQTFLSVVTVNTLRTWGSRPDAELRCFFERGNGSLYVGRDANGKLRVPIGKHAEFSIPEIPDRA